MQFCPKCGTPVEDGMVFCINCGTKVTEQLSSDTSPVDIPRKEKRKKKYAAIFVLAIAALISIFLYISANSAAKAEKALVGQWNGAYVKLDDGDLVGSDVIGEFFCKASDDGSFVIDGDIFDSMALVWEFNADAGQDSEESFDYIYNLKSSNEEDTLTIGYCAISEDSLIVYIRAGESGSIAFVFNEKNNL